jgi:tRNA modification GTPase
MVNSDTIFARSSGAGVAGIAVYRVSGPAALASLSQIAGDSPPERHAALRTLRNPDTGEPIDRGMVVLFRGPRSFTGEDMCEFHTHASRAVEIAMIDALSALPGLRHAQPGEFTLRAFRNGRMDLLEVEGLADLLQAKTAGQRRLALQHVCGFASETIEGWRNELVAIRARIEAAVDFIEEHGVAETAIAGLQNRVRHLSQAMKRALDGARRADVIRDGVRVVIAGPPNVGKSSLLNAIAKRDAAIVSAIPGTTRDVIEVTVEMAGVPVIISDTAGLRDRPGDEIEAAGLAKTKRELANAEIVLWLSAPSVEGAELPDSVDSEPIRVWNKSDLTKTGAANVHYYISAKTGEGLPELLDGLAQRIRGLGGEAEPGAVVRSRHQHAIIAVLRALDAVHDAKSMQLELVAENLREASDALGRITGRIDVEDLLDAIFREFCVGK